MRVKIDIKKSNKLNEEYAMFVSFPYNKSIVSAIQGLPFRYWIADTKEWEVPVKNLEFLMDVFGNNEVEIKVDPQLLANPVAKVDIERQLPDGFEFKTNPFKHQIDGFYYGLENKKWLLGDEQGLGKTKQVIDIAVARKATNGYKHCLIICGVNGLKWNWQKEVKTHSSETAYILGQRIQRNGKLKIGSTKDKIEDLRNIDKLPYFIITNVESFRNPSEKKNSKEDTVVSLMKKLCANGTIGMIAFDECHKAKDPSSQQGKGILELRADSMIAMTGTPLMNSPMDLYMILRWLGYESHSFYSFKNMYCHMGGYGGHQIVGYKNLDRLQAQLDTIMLRRLKKNVLDLPEKIFIDEYVEMDGKQEQIYKETISAIKNNIDLVKVSPNPLAQMIRARQATGYPGILSSMIKDNYENKGKSHESAKLGRMREIVDEAVNNGQKVVIFSNWTEMTDVVLRELRNYHCAVITGDTKDNDRQAMVDRFQNDDSCKVIVGTIGAMGTGLTLTAGTVEIFLDEPWNMALKDQAVDRCHRIGAKSNVTIYTLLTKDTIDERIHQLVYEKGAMADALVDKKISNESMVDFLLS